MVRIKARDLVKQGGRFVKQLPDQGSLAVAAGQAENIVHSLGSFAVVDLLGDVFVHLLQLLHILIQGVG